MSARALLSLVPLAVVACTDVTTPIEDNEGEVITTVVLTFTPESGDPVVAAWADPEDDGDPVVDDVVLTAGVTYELTVELLDELSDPAEDITEEVEEEADEHQIFLTGTAVAGPATDLEDAALTVAYADEDDAGLPLGLVHDVTAAEGSGSLLVTLQHLPPEDGVAVKTADLADLVASDGLGALPGDTDVVVTFDVIVVE